uniref:GPI ethanolamine phosphate transferase 1 n=1 Tax=Schistocephalus solidus TaxID=70667 RepID=A0A0X3PAD5_SCHSO
MVRISVSRLRLSLSVLLYLILFYSIFDIYYTSPLVHGIKPIRPDAPPLVRNVVFIVTDGLRVDKLFTENMDDTPILRDIILNKGIWGLSHTRVPTESRPGHVALFAGFYEDVASVTKGWQVNAVEFDSVVNRSNRAWIWGGPDVVPMLQPSDRIGDDRVFISSYPRGMLDFTAENITQIDDWVVDKFSTFLVNNSHLLLTEEGVREDFRRGNFIFLHLSAADQLGHTAKPSSPEYFKMIRNIDSNIGRILKLFSDLPFGEEILLETAFILTADHGMTDWGSHGAGSPQETITPLIIWGSGISGPEVLENQSVGVGETELLRYHYNRKIHIVRQADICPLIAALLGIPIPANSVGEVPLDVLEAGQQLKAELIRSNALQIIAQFQVKYTEQKASHYRAFFQEFSSLTQAELSKLMSVAAQLTADGHYAPAISTYRQIIRHGLEGLNYYHKYDRFFMGLCIMLSYILWSVILCSDIVSHHSYRRDSFAPGSLSWNICAFCIASGIILTFTSAFDQSWLRTLYQLLPLALSLLLITVPAFRDVVFHMVSLASESRSNAKVEADSRSPTTFTVLLLVALLELALWGFMYRFLLSFGAILLGLWPFADPSFIGQRSKRLQVAWLLACLALACFPLLPLVGSFASPLLVLLGSLCVSAVSMAFSRVFATSPVVQWKLAQPQTYLVNFAAGLLFAKVLDLPKLPKSLAYPGLLGHFKK